MRRVLLALLIGGLAGVAACAGAAKMRLVRWQTFVHAHAPVDLAGPRADGSLVLAASGRLLLLLGSGAVKPFASGYHGSGGEPYIALPAPGHKGCSFGAAVYALKLGSPHGVVAVGANGHVRRVATLQTSGLESGIAFDETGRFGHRLLVTTTSGGETTVNVINCHGKARAITSTAPRVEGGIAVAPPGFGRYGGDLIAPDELSGKIFAITPQGKSLLVATSDLPSGQDVGVESEAFVPNLKRFGMLLADRLTPGNPHPGDDLLLSLSGAQLLTAGVHAGELLVATEGGAKVDAVSCSAGGCRVQHVGDGPAIAHAEGHIAVLPG